MLIIDIGNTAVKFAIGGESVLNLPVRALDIAEVFPIIQNNPQARPVIFSSVSPIRATKLEDFLADNAVPYHRVTHFSPFSFSIDYQKPELLGTDRLCSMEAAVDLCREESGSQPDVIITVDCGTASTINILKHGEFKGGLIFPGLMTMADSLVRHTAQLPKVNFTNEIKLIGNNTISCIESGVVFATVGAIETVIHRFTTDQDYPKVFITGGNAAHILPYLNFTYHYDEFLNLSGLQYLALRVFSK